MEVYERVLIIWVALEIFRCNVFTLKLYVKDNETQLITLEMFNKVYQTRTIRKKSVDERVSLECSVNTGVSIHWTGLLVGEANYRTKKKDF